MGCFHGNDVFACTDCAIDASIRDIEDVLLAQEMSEQARFVIGDAVSRLKVATATARIEKAAKEEEAMVKSEHRWEVVLESDRPENRVVFNSIDGDPKHVKVSVMGHGSVMVSADDLLEGMNQVAQNILATSRGS